MAIFSFTNFVVVCAVAWLCATLSGLSDIVDPTSNLSSEGGEEAANRVGPLWSRGQGFSLVLFLSERSKFVPFSVAELQSRQQLLLHRRHLTFSNDTLNGLSINLNVHRAGSNANAGSRANAGDVAMANGAEKEVNEVVSVPVPMWDVLRSNSTRLFLHMALLRSAPRPDAKERIVDGCHLNGESEGEACHASSAVVSKKHVDDGRVLYGTVRLLKHDPVPKTYRNRYLLADVQPWLDQLDRSVLGQLWARAVGCTLCEALVRPLNADQQERLGWAHDRVVSYWKPEVSLKLVTDWTRWPIRSMPTPVYRNLVQTSTHDVGGQGQGQGLSTSDFRYKPSLIADEIGLTSDKYVPLNTSLAIDSVLPLRLSFSGMSLQRWLFVSTIEENLGTQKEVLGVSDKDLDDVRRLITDTSPWLLAVTLAASFLHLLFEVLAFHSDIQFWRQNKTLQGLSVRSVVAELVSQAIVLLYLWDNETSMVVILPAGAGVFIQAWKVRRSTGACLAMHWLGPVPVPWVCFSRLAVERSNQQQEQDMTVPEGGRREGGGGEAADKLVAVTLEADRLATWHLTLAFAPLLIGYTLRSLILDMHQSWYSFFVGTLTACVYTFGFVLMCPQLYINHRLKSVSHLPWNFLVYKFLNTFIDDLFAFVIKMPLMHRLSVFRDDLVFLVYLYQRWAYRVDVSRPMEK